MILLPQLLLKRKCSLTKILLVIPASVAAELSQALSTALSLTDTMPPASCLSDSLARTAAMQPSTDLFLQQKQQPFNDCSDKLLSSAYSSDNNSVKSSSAAKKSNAEISKLLQQHYCSHKNKKKHPAPSASAIRKGKVPLPSSCVVDEGDSSDELSEDSSSLPPGKMQAFSLCVTLIDFLPLSKAS